MVCSQKCGRLEVGPVKSQLKSVAMINFLRFTKAERVNFYLDRLVLERARGA